jgi:hypothetical protein
MGQRFNKRPSRSRDGTFLEMKPCEAVRTIQREFTDWAPNPTTWIRKYEEARRKKDAITLQKLKDETAGLALKANDRMSQGFNNSIR